MRPTFVSLAYVFFSLFAFSIRPLAQGTNPPPPQDAQTARTPAIKASRTAQASVPSTRRQASNPPLGDFVPCMFDIGENYDLRTRPNPYDQNAPIAAPEAPQITTSATNQIQAQADSDNAAQASLNDVIKKISAEVPGANPLPSDTTKFMALAVDPKSKSTLSQIFQEATTKNLQSKDVTAKLQAQANNAGSESQILQSTIPVINNLQSRLVGLTPNEAVNLMQATVAAVVPASDAAKAAGPEATKTAISNATPAITAAVNQVISVQEYKRPDDVSCSFSILDWHETSDVFGRRVANDYVAVEVNIRNLNTQSEFLIHDIQIAVDTGLSEAQFGRFKAGRDRLIVRGVAQRGQSEDRRNLIVNILQMMGAIAGGASTAVTQANSGSDAAMNLSSAVAIFQSAFIPGLINVFPDHTIDHINHLNDLAFSASATSKVIVPVQGSVPLVTFLMEKPLEQLPYARCGESALADTTEDAEQQDTGNPSNPNDTGSARYDFCKLHQFGRRARHNPRAYDQPLHFKKWKPAALRILEDRVFVVVGGVHIQEVSNNPVVNNLSCPVLADGVSINISKTDKDGNIGCSLTGSKLDKAKTATLIQGTTKVTATYTPATDGNTANLSFAAKDVSAASGSYSLMFQDASGNNVDSKQTIKFAGGPIITAVNYFVAPDNGLNVVISGSNLDRIASVVMVDKSKTPATAITSQVSLPAGQATASTPTITAKLPTADAAKLTKGQTYSMQFVAVGDSTKTLQDVPNSSYTP